jgi:hypothetical protein
MLLTQHGVYFGQLKSFAAINRVEAIANRSERFLFGTKERESCIEDLASRSKSTGDDRFVYELLVGWRNVTCHAVRSPQLDGNRASYDRALL